MLVSVPVAHQMIAGKVHYLGPVVTFDWRPRANVKLTQK